MEEESKAIVLAADVGYLMPLSATLKSIFANRYHGTVYVMNNDIPQEWFEIVNDKLQYGKVQDIKIDKDILNKTDSPRKYINYMTYARIFAPEYINVDKLLYLDSDIIVDSNLDNLLNYDLGDHLIAAVPDLDNIVFNAGVLLLNSKELNRQNFTKNIWNSVSDRDLSYGDQSLLNEYFKENYVHLSIKYNYQIGADKALYYNSIIKWFSEDEKKQITDNFVKITHPVIYHFTTPDKPWKLTSSVSKRDLWWKYYSLDWDKLDKPVEFPKFDKKVFIFTSLAELRDIEVLVKRFPNIEFNIAAYVDMIFMLKRLLQYDNVKLYPMIVGKNIDKLIKESDAMLDITDGPDNEITKRFAETGKPIIGFREDKFNGVIPEDGNYELVHSTDEMIEKLENL